jgi:large subunit ribosomal protein L16
MLQPRRVKHRKQHRGRRSGAAGAGNYIAFGEFGLQAQGAAWIDSRHIEWVAVVKPDRIMFEIAGVPEDVAREALRLAAHKLPVPTKIVQREEAVI